MPIEDVDFLRKNSIKQSYIFLVNSAERNRVAYPTPSEYVVEFTTPFQNVVGLQVLHASIPRTMYNVDVRNNKLVFMIYDGEEAIPDLSALQTVYLTPGDYSIQTLVEELNSKLRVRLPNHSDEVMITAQTTTNPPNVQSLLRFTCPYPFLFDMQASTVAETLGFDLHVDVLEQTKSVTEQRYRGLPSSLQTPPNHKLYHSVDLDPSVRLGEERLVYDGPRGVIRKIPLQSRVAQQFTVKASGYLTKVFAALTTAPDSSGPGSEAVWEIYRDVNGSPGGEPIPLLSPGTNQPITGYIPVSFTDGSLSDQDDPVVARLNVGLYWIVLSAARATSKTSVYYNDVPSNLQAGLFKVWNGTSWISQDTDNEIHFELCVRVIMQDRYHALTAPGMYSLIGERFIVLRCPEIEENSYRSLAYGKHCLGLAKFQLGVVGYSETRLDFNSIMLREFHPIGKLSKLTLRFETASGELYDFKGINHDLTVAVHYYEPVQKQEFQQSILNPNYSANVLHYISNQYEQESDDQDYEYDEDDLSEFRAQEARHLPENVRRLDLDALNEFDLSLGEEDDEYTDEDASSRE